MAIAIVRLGSPRTEGEGLRIGTVCRVPRGVPKERFAKDDWFDVWYPDLAPRPDLMAEAKANRNEAEWDAFVRKFRKQMGEQPASRNLDLLAALSHTADFSMGCYCEDESRCHRSVLRELLRQRGATLRD